MSFNETNILAVSVDPVIFTMKDNKLMVLLMKREKGPFENSWALPGGLMERYDENIKFAINRVLKEKTKVNTNYLEQLCSRTGHDPRGPTVSIAYIGLTDFQEMQMDNVEWIEFDDAKNYKLAFDHNEILNQAYDRLITKVNYSTLPVYFLPEKFILYDLYNIYNSLLKDNKSASRFRSKIMETGALEETKEMQHRGAARPAALYKTLPGGPRYFKSNYIG